MIIGIIANHRPIIRCIVRGPNGQETEIETVLDTGFTGFLTLPPAIVAALNLPFANAMPARLADGSRIMLSVHTVWITWDGVERDIDALAMGNEPLIGMSLLEGSDVFLQVKEGGLVTIETS